jgi:hypothetical protein
MTDDSLSQIYSNSLQNERVNMKFVTVLDFIPSPIYNHDIFIPLQLKTKIEAYAITVLSGPLSVCIPPN